jgi:DNA-binding PucR family transcriptional regulator
MRRANYDNLLAWATANLRAPGEPVPANASALQLDVARDLVRRGLDKAALDGYRTGQSAALHHWIQIGFEVTQDPVELQEFLTVSVASVGAFIDATMAALAEHMDAERDELTRGSQAERRDMVSLILAGAPVPRTRAEALLAHRLDGDHTASLVWTPDYDSDLGMLERAAEALMRASGARQRLTVVAGATTLWVWLPAAVLPDPGELGEALSRTPEVRIAIGTPANGIEGFRRSHQDAVEARRLVARLGTPTRVITFEDVRLVSLLTQDPVRAQEFVNQVLGDLAAAPPELHETVRTYLRLMGNATATASALFTHRNTVIRRITTAERLLPRPLHQDPLSVAAALETVRWHRADVVT